MELTHKTRTARYPELGTDPLPIRPCIDPDVFKAEREAVFRRSWLNVGRVELVPEAGDYFVRDIEVCYTSVLVVRGRDNVIRAFHNMCSHRANQVVWKNRGKCRGAFVCPFHGWAFDTRGKLVNMTDRENFFTGPDANLDMTEVQADVWNGFIFIRLKPQDDQSLEDYLEPVSSSLKDYPFAELTRREWYSVDEKVNWKVLLDAQLEGWHVPFLHRDSLARSTSAAGMLLRHSVLEALGPHGLLGTEPPPVFNPTPVGEASLKYGIGAYDAFAFIEPRRTDAQKYHLRGAMNLYFIFPNVIMGLMRDCYWMYNVWPLAVDRTVWEIGVNTVPPRNAGELFCQEYNKVGLRDTLMEDTATHEKVQQVLKSGAKEHFHFQDEELALRNFHHAVDACLAAVEDSKSGA